MSCDTGSIVPETSTMVVVVNELIGMVGSSNAVLALLSTVHCRPCGPWIVKEFGPVTPTTPP